MQKTILKYLFFVIIVISVTACKHLCKLPEEYQSMIDSANTKYGTYLYIENIPCEPNYINVKLHSNNLDSIMIGNVHNILYNAETKKGWLTLWIFDSDNNYITSHSNNGLFYYQSGD
jgi:hypothetical protein